MDGTRSRGRISSIINFLIVGLQFICAIIVLGIIGVRFHRTAFSTAVYVVLISVLTVVTTLALAFLTYRPSQSHMIIVGSLGWQVLMVIFWAACAGALGARGDTRSTGVRAAVALSVIELVLFLASSIVVGIAFWRGRRATIGAKHTV